MRISRREFFDYCRNSTAVLAVGGLDLTRLERALANPNAPTVLWLQGSACTGCSVSFLNRISPAAPATAANVLLETVNLAYHPNLMGAAGDLAVAQARKAYDAGGYVLVVEGGVPTAFGGNTCWAWTVKGTTNDDGERDDEDHDDHENEHGAATRTRDVTFLQAVRDYSAKASQVIAVGTCACFGGIAAGGPNPTGVKGVGAATLKKTLNIAGCPPHPDWIVWAIAALLTNSVGPLDSYNRPMALYGKTVHEQCPRIAQPKATAYGQDHLCLMNIGCLGPATQAACPLTGWNNGVNWCVDANATCLGCTSATFPFDAIRRS